MPDAWLPTWTVVTAWSVPVAETLLRMFPRPTRAVMKSSALARRSQSENPATARTAAARIMIQRIFLPPLIFNFIFIPLAN